MQVSVIKSKKENCILDGTDKPRRKAGKTIWRRTAKRFPFSFPIVVLKSACDLKITHQIVITIKTPCQ